MKGREVYVSTPHPPPPAHPRPACLPGCRLPLEPPTLEGHGHHPSQLQQEQMRSEPGKAKRVLEGFPSQAGWWEESVFWRGDKAFAFSAMPCDFWPSREFSQSFKAPCLQCWPLVPWEDPPFLLELSVMCLMPAIMCQSLSQVSHSLLYLRCTE